MQMADFSVVILHSVLAFFILLTRVLAHEATNPLTSNNQQIHHADHVPLQKHAQSPDASHHQSEHAVHTMDRNIVQNQELVTVLLLHLMLLYIVISSWPLHVVLILSRDLNLYW
jgi:hypothetical protein